MTENTTANEQNNPLSEETQTSNEPAQTPSEQTNTANDQLTFFPTPAPAKPEAKKPAPGRKPDEPEEYDKDRVVAYAGHKHLITDRKLSLEEIRKMLEKDYPELSKDRCEMTYDDKTGIIVPVVKGSRKGGR